MTFCHLHEGCKYEQLGMFLMCWQVLHNMALTEAQLGNWGKAQESLVKALDYRTDSKLGVIDNALQATLVSRSYTRVARRSLFQQNDV